MGSEIWIGWSVRSVVLGTFISFVALVLFPAPVNIYWWLLVIAQFHSLDVSNHLCHKVSLLVMLHILMSFNRARGHEFSGMVMIRFLTRYMTSNAFSHTKGKSSAHVCAHFCFTNAASWICISIAFSNGIRWACMLRKETSTLHRPYWCEEGDQRTRLVLAACVSDMASKPADSSLFFLSVYRYCMYSCWLNDKSWFCSGLQASLVWLCLLSIKDIAESRMGTSFLTKWIYWFGHGGNLYREHKNWS